MGLMDQTAQWSMWVPVSADICLVGPRPPQPDPEHCLFESYIVELTQIYGFEIEYYPLVPTGMDAIYGEGPNKEFLGPYPTKVIYKPGDEPNLFEIFGMISDEVIDSMVIPQYTFWRDVSASPYGPNPGDVIRATWNRSQTGVSGLNDVMYEVTGVCDTDNTFLGLKFTYEIKVRPYRSGQEDNIVATDSLDPFTGLGDSLPLSAWGDNDAIQVESEEIDDYADVITEVEKLYGFE
jgi:hypothetical protein